MTNSTYIDRDALLHDINDMKARILETLNKDRKTVLDRMLENQRLGTYQALEDFTLVVMNQPAAQVIPYDGR